MKRAVIDTRGQLAPEQPGPLTRIAGLPVIARLVRLAARNGLGGVTIAVEAEHRAALEHCLARYPAPDGFEVTLTAAPPADADAVTFDARGVYRPADVGGALADGREPVPAVVVRDRADVRAADRVLLDTVKKSVQADGVLSFYVLRQVALPLTRMLLPTPVTPNMVTLTAMVLGITAAVLAGIGGRLEYTIAAILFFVGLLIDHIDGQLARLRMKGSRLGEWLDTLTDDITTFGLMAGVGVGMYRMGYHPAWAQACVGGAILGTLAHGKLYYDLARWKLPIDTAYYPWFFGTPAASEAAPRGLVGHLGNAVGYLVRRDAFTTILCALMIAFVPIPLALALVIRGLALVPLVLVNEVVRLVRGDAGGR